LLVDRTPTRLSRQQFQRHADEGGTKTMAERRTAHGMPDLLASGHRELLGLGRAQLPLPPLPMFDVGDPEAGQAEHLRRESKTGRGGYLR
jgi:hypothetical protein